MNSNPDCCGLHRDAKYLCEKSREIADLLDCEHTLVPNDALRDLHDLMRTLSRSLNSPKTDHKLASTPLSRPTRELSNKHDGTNNPTPQPVNLIIATMGWWEIISPNPRNIQNLCIALAKRKIGVCMVTGLASGVVAEIP